MRRLLVVLAILLLPTLAAAGVAPTKTDRPAWCEPGWSCIPTKELADDARYKIALEERLGLAEAKLKARRLFGWHTTCGLALAAVPTDNFDVKMTPAGYCGIGYGW